jgi:tetratricopeptide (TPR) repeat protein
MIDREPTIRNTERDLPSRTEAIDYAAIVAGPLGGAEPALCDEAARALFNHAVRLGGLGRAQEAITLYTEVVARFADEPQLAFRQLVAAALIFKGVTLGVLGRDEEAIAAYDELIARCADSPEPALREKVARARDHRRMRLGLSSPGVAYRSVAEPGRRHVEWIGVLGAIGHPPGEQTRHRRRGGARVEN